MQSWLARRVIAYVMAQTRAGNIRPTLLLDAPEVTLTFPGDNSWSGVFEGRDAVKRWLTRLTDVGIQTYPDEVLATGLPWKMTVCVRGHDDCRAPSGELVYENRFVIWGHMKWGRLTDYEVYEDTVKAGAFDGYLARERPDLAAAHPLSGAGVSG
jgi:ketosteroid isomerase-like protein